MTKINIILISLSVLALVLVGKLGFTSWELSRSNDKLNEKLMEADLELGKAETSFGNAEDKINKLGKELQKVIKENEEKLTQIGELEAELNYVKKKKGTGETIYVEGPRIEVSTELNLTRGLMYEAVTNKTLAAVSKLKSTVETDGIKVGAEFSFYPNKNREFNSEFTIDLNLKIEAILGQTIGPTGAINNYAEVYYLSDNGQRIKKFNITKFRYVVKKPNEKRFFFWTPNIDLGALGLGSIYGLTAGGSLGFSIAGYGLTSKDLTWKFIRPSVDLIGKNIGVGFTPAMYNIGEHIPLISDLWVGPHGSYDFTKWHLGAFIGTNL